MWLLYILPLLLQTVSILSVRRNFEFFNILWRLFKNWNNCQCITWIMWPFNVLNQQQMYTSCNAKQIYKFCSARTGQNRVWQTAKTCPVSNCTYIMYNTPVGSSFSYLLFCWRNLSRYKKDQVDPNKFKKQKSQAAFPFWQCHHEKTVGNIRYMYCRPLTDILLYLWFAESEIATGSKRKK